MRYPLTSCFGRRSLGQTSSPRLACFAAARFAVRRSLSVFCAGFLPSFLGFCEPFTCILPGR